VLSDPFESLERVHEERFEPRHDPLRDYVQTAPGEYHAVPGVIPCVQIFGALAHLHPHLHLLMSDGAFTAIRGSRRRLVMRLLVHAGIVLLTAPVLWLLLGQLRLAREAWMPTPGPADIIDLAREITFGAYYLVPVLGPVALLPLARRAHRRAAAFSWWLCCSRRARPCCAAGGTDASPAPRTRRFECPRAVPRPSGAQPPHLIGSSPSRCYDDAMNRSRGSEGPAAPPALWLLPALPVCLALIVHRRALGAFFGPDDLIRLEQAAGLLPHARTLWRLVSEVWYVALMLRQFGPDPLPFHATTLGLHLVNTIFIYRVVTRMGRSPAAAVLASSLFGTCPLFYSVLLSAVNINDVMALTFSFLALLVLEVSTRVRAAAALLLFALSLLSKEAVLFVPFAAVFLRSPEERLGAAARRLAPLLAAGASFAALYLLFRTHGLGTGGEAYAVGFGANLVHNVMTYAKWGIDLHDPIPDLAGVYSTSAWRTGVWPLALLFMAAALFRVERKTIVAGLAWWLLGLVPVLPLLRHSFGHYLYVPMAGWVLSLAGAADGAAATMSRVWTPDIRRRIWQALPGARPRPAAPGRRRLRLVPFVAAAIGGAAWSEVLIGARAQLRLGATDLALDPLTRKLEVARRAIATIGRPLDRPHGRAVVFLPAGTERAIDIGTGAEGVAHPPGTPSYNLVSAVLDGGRAVRLFCPQIDSIVFISRWSDAYRDFYLFSQGAAGEMTGLGTGPSAHARLAELLLANGYGPQAAQYLSALVETWPGDRRLRFLWGLALARTGDRAGALDQLKRVADAGPADSLGTAARELLRNAASRHLR